MDDHKSNQMEGPAGPRSRLAAWAARHEIALFFALTFVLSWGAYLWIARARISDFNRWTLVAAYGPSVAAVLIARLADPERERPRRTQQAAVFVIAFAAAAGVEWLDQKLWYHRLTTPLIVSDVLLVFLAAFVISGVLSSRRGVRRLLQGLTRWRVGPGWYLLAFGLWPALVLAGNWLAGLFGLEVPTGPYHPTRYPIAVLAVESFFWYLLFGGPLNEEAGWRGFAQPRLQRRMSPLTASLIVGAAWGLWHVPVHLMGLYPGGAAGSVIRLFDIPLAVIFTWLLIHTRQSLLPVLILHAVVNTTSLFLPRNYLTSSLLILALAIVLVFVDKMWRPPSASAQRAAPD